MDANDKQFWRDKAKHAAAHIIRITFRDPDPQEAELREKIRSNIEASCFKHFCAMAEREDLQDKANPSPELIDHALARAELDGLIDGFEAAGKPWLQNNADYHRFADYRAKLLAEVLKDPYTINIEEIRQ